MKTEHLTHLTDTDIEVQYTYYEDKGDYENEYYSSLEIQKMIYEGIDIKDLLLEVAPDYIDDLTERLEGII